MEAVAGPGRMSSTYMAWTTMSGSGVRSSSDDDELESLDFHHPRSPTSKFHSLQSPPTIPHFVIRSIP